MKEGGRRGGRLLLFFERGEEEEDEGGGRRGWSGGACVVCVVREWESGREREGGREGRRRAGEGREGGRKVGRGAVVWARLCQSRSAPFMQLIQSTGCQCHHSAERATVTGV